jgi:hypothetical protein
MPIEKAGSFYLMRGTPEQVYKGIIRLEIETKKNKRIFDGHIHAAKDYGHGNIIVSDGKGNLAFLRVYVSSNNTVFRGSNSAFSPHELSVISRLDELMGLRHS